MDGEVAPMHQKIDSSLPVDLKPGETLSGYAEALARGDVRPTLMDAWVETRYFTKSDGSRIQLNGETGKWELYEAGAHPSEFTEHESPDAAAFWNDIRPGMPV